MPPNSRGGYCWTSLCRALTERLTVWPELVLPFAEQNPFTPHYRTEIAFLRDNAHCDLGPPSASLVSSRSPHPPSAQSVTRTAIYMRPHPGP